MKLTGRPLAWLAGARTVVLALLGGLVLAVLAAPPAAAAPLSIPDTMAARMAACVPCHGREGRATSQGFFPRIAGKPSGYLFNQLVNFRDGRRSNTVMAAMVEQMNDDYLRQIADYFSALDLPYPPPAAGAPDAVAAARGEQLVHRGAPERDIPACTSCHGAAMTGMLPAVPGLLGLPRDYLLAQFGAWRNGQRTTGEPDCMATIARRLSPQDVGAVAAWLAAQPVPPRARAQAPGAQPAPMRCATIAP